ncbi:hypothetical protein DMT57_23715 [Salmonella enterica]|nr:hypothetical protein [Salmonella enterica]EAM3112714.1 hypothetical protein [Salmonella enterica]EAM3231320.1 hypothetical protein [Salmonella enterica]EAS2279013.1 hypothetical protein [Salmonella enterica]ECH9065998.1 hypothetical protein [Salmonella enterica subsp. enterica]
MPCGLFVLHRTYPDHDLVGWRPCNPLFNTLIIIHINVLYFTLRCNKGIKKVLWLKINHILNVMTNGEELNS